MYYMQITCSTSRSSDTVDIYIYHSFLHKPELAGKAHQVVRDEFDLVLDQANKFSQVQFNKLVAQYAKKALEFTVIQYIDGKCSFVGIFVS